MEDTLKNGVTTVRDVASADSVCIALKVAKKAGLKEVQAVYQEGTLVYEV